MRFRPGVVLASLCVILVALFAGPCPAYAAEAPPVSIKSIFVGLPDGAGDKATARSRNGTWTPVAVELATVGDIAADRFRVLLTCTDSEDTTYHYLVAVPALAANATQTVFGYVRPGNLSSEISATIATADGAEVPSVRPVTLSRTAAGQDILEPREYLLLSLGARLPGLKMALLPPADPKNAGAGNKPPAAEDDKPMRSLAIPDRVAQLPDRWFGYDAVDVVFLSTGNEKFLRDLQEDKTGRREALIEWVRRGGRLVLSIGRNRDLFSREKLPFLPFKLDGFVHRTSLGFDPWLPNDMSSRLPPIDLTIFTADSQTEVLVSASATDKDKLSRPVVAQAPFGLGRVILVPFDLDAGPFVEEVFSEGRAVFWNKMMAELSIRPLEARAVTATHLELADVLARGIEEFEAVPTVSFGWVAFFILIYILIVGPLDYIILKKFFRRLEWTWFSFPLIVLAVSGAIYWTAYSAKGDDLRVNKLDLVEVDLHGGQVFGSSWFTLFSTSIKDYSIGIEPETPTWAAGASTTTVVATLDPPQRTTRQGSQTLLRRPYAYAANATAVEGIAVPVWATRSFTASWRAPLDPQKPPIDARIKRPLAGEPPVGTITNHLPVALRDVVLIWDEKVYRLSEILPPADPLWYPGVEWRIDEMFNEQVRKPLALKPWLDEAAPPVGKPVTISPSQVLKLALFHDGAESERWRASGLRELDQQWRIRPLGDNKVSRNQIMLIARALPLSGPLDHLKRAGQRADSFIPDGAPTRLRFQDSALMGILTQETMIRVYIPFNPN